jgi:predicted metalloprotease with PDZ domain
VRFALPDGWQAVVPWPALRGAREAATAASIDDLCENLVAFVAGKPDVLTAGGFNLKVVAMGHWESARDEVLRVLGVAAQRLVAFIGFTGQGDYLVVLLPQEDKGGESFRASFAMTENVAPSQANLGDWGNTIAHEVFHYWNAWRLRGADYPSSQWFQEGFTEYAANLALVSGQLTTPAEFYGELAAHVTHYRELATPLDAPGTHKGPPLYSGGALVAFIWDTEIRKATGGKQGVGDVLRVLLHSTDDGARPYTWADIRAALESLTPGDWEGFYRDHIHGSAALPIDEAFARAGLRISQNDDGTVRVEEDPDASEAARAVRGAVMGGGR